MREAKVLTAGRGSVRGQVIVSLRPGLPCPICRATIAATRIAAVYYAVSSEEANDILSVVPPTVRRRSDIARMRAIAGGGGDLPTTLIETPGAREVLRRWAEHRSG